MGGIADSLFTLLMGWVRALVSGIWALFSTDQTTILEFLGKHWLLIAVVLIAAGLVIDWLVWLVRWQPYHLWAQRVRRLLHLPPPQEDEEEEEHPVRPAKQPAPKPAPQPAPEPDWLPLEQPALTGEDEQRVMQQAQSVPDEALGAYPGMRYGAMSTAAPVGSDTQRYAAVHSEGPGAAEVARRRAEIDAWQQQMQEEARQQAEARRAYEAEQARLAQEAYEAEQARLAQEAYEAEQARLAQEAYEAEQARLAQEAYEAEQARLVQEEYERQLAEYERQQAQYERDMAEYERQKAAYDAEMARRQAQAEFEAGQREEESPTVHRRRSVRSGATYSDYVAGDAVGELPDPPAWPQAETPVPQEPAAPAREKKTARDGGLMAKMARMIEPEEDEITGLKALPPRVDMHDAYKPPKKPQKPGRRPR